MSDTVKSSNRLVFLDLLRVFAAGAVVLMHTVSGVLNGGFDMTGYERRRCAFLALVAATAWSVPVFLMISGYLLLAPGRRITWKDAVLRYCRRAFLALLVFGVPYALLEIVGWEKTFRWSMIPRAFLATATGKSWAHMWYLYLILLLYAITPILKWILERLPRGAVYALLILLFGLSGILPFAEALLGATRIICLPRELIYLFYYLTGYVLVTKKRKAFASEDIWCLVLFGVIILLEMGSRFLPGYELNLAYAYPPTVLASVLLFNGCMEWEKAKGVAKPVKERGSFWGSCRALAEMSFGIYLIHPVFLNFFYKYKRISIMNFRFYVGVPLFFLISFAGAALVTWVLRKISILRKYVL